MICIDIFISLTVAFFFRNFDDLQLDSEPNLRLEDDER